MRTRKKGRKLRRSTGAPTTTTLAITTITAVNVSRFKGQDVAITLFAGRCTSLANTLTVPAAPSPGLEPQGSDGHKQEGAGQEEQKAPPKPLSGSFVKDGVDLQLQITISSVVEDGEQSGSSQSFEWWRPACS
eukprot:scaffold158464_cov21-Tisochrysis_lutea.AAC.1